MIEAGAQALAHSARAGVEGRGERRQLQVILRHGALVAEFPLPDDAEPAPVFKA